MAIAKIVFAIFASSCVILAVGAQTDYVVPAVQLEALKSRGFRAYIPDVPGTSSFTLHANVNEDITQLDPGKLVGEATETENGFWVVSFDRKLNQGDKVNYWVFVSAHRLGYRKDGDSWYVSELLDSYPPLKSSCNQAHTIMDGKAGNVCSGSLIFEDDFSGPKINNEMWTVEHKIPTYSEPNFEFNSYENRDETRFFKDGKLFLKPIPLFEDQVRGTLDLRAGCTSNKQNECFYEHASSFILPPIKSARITSKFSFKYGKIEIRAKLPAGDWIYPIIVLEPKDKSEDPNAAKVLIAYSRGNDHLSVVGKDDIGSRVLFAGPMMHPVEPGRSRRLIKRPATERYSDDFHVYGLEWVPGKMSFTFDTFTYSSVTNTNGFSDSSLGIGNNWKEQDAPFNKEYVLSLGVAVGGINDFPDDYTSGSNAKPWINGERNYIKKFFDRRSKWLQSWKADQTALQVDYIKIWAV